MVLTKGQVVIDLAFSSLAGGLSSSSHFVEF